MAKRRCCMDDENIRDESDVVKMYKGFASTQPIRQRRDPLAELADRRVRRQSDTDDLETDGSSHRRFADELSMLNKRFVDFCQRSVSDDKHCFLFSGFNDYMQHFMGLFATYLAPNPDSKLTRVCFQRLREQCQSRFANVGRYVSLVVDASTNTDIDDSPMVLRSAMTTSDSNSKMASRVMPDGQNAAARNLYTGGNLDALTRRRRRILLRTMHGLLESDLDREGMNRSLERANAVSSPIMKLKNGFDEGFEDATRNNRNRRYFQLRKQLETSNAKVLLGDKSMQNVKSAVLSIPLKTPVPPLKPQPLSPKLGSNVVRISPITGYTGNDKRSEGGNYYENEKSTEKAPTKADEQKAITPKKSHGVASPKKNISPRKQLAVSANAGDSSVLCNGTSNKKKKDKSSTTPPLNIFELAKKPGWDCEICMVRNPVTASACLSCTTLKPKSKTDKADAESGIRKDNSTDNPVLGGSTSWFCTKCMQVQQSSSDACTTCGHGRTNVFGFGGGRMIGSPAKTTATGISPATPRFSFARSGNSGCIPNSPTGGFQFKCSMPASSTSMDGSKQSTSKDINDEACEIDDTVPITVDVIDHTMPGAVFATKCKMYYLNENNEYVKRGNGFLSIVVDEKTNGKSLIFRAENVMGTTILSAKVTTLMNPTVISEKNIRLMTIPYPKFYEEQNINKPVIVLFKLINVDLAKKCLAVLDCKHETNGET